jgi:hypothetical protein
VYIRGTTLPIEREVRQTTLTVRHTTAAQENKIARSVGKVSKIKEVNPPPNCQSWLQTIGALVLLGITALASIKLFNWYNKR